MRAVQGAWALALVVAVVCGGCASGGSPTPPDGGGVGEPVTGLLAGGGALNGYVSAPTGEVGVSHLRPDSGAIFGATVLADTGQVGFTNASGAYWIPGVPVGVRTVSITAPGTSAKTIRVTVTARQITSGTVSAESLAAVGPGALNGYVYETESGMPELAAGPAIGRRPVQDAALSLETGQTGRTDAEGFFHIAGVPAGFRTLTLVTESGTGTETVLVPAGRIASGSGQLPSDWGACRGYVGTPRAAGLPKLVVAADGSQVNPIVGALVQLSSGESALTTKDGAYAFSGVASGNPSITVRARGGLERTEGIIIASGVITEGLTPPSGFICRVEIASVSGAFDVAVGSALWLRASALDASSRPYPTYGGFSWLSRNTAVATVDSHGVVTARQVGSAEIAVSADGVTGEVTVNVHPAAEGGPYRVEIEAPATVIGQGTSMQLSARVITSSGEGIPGAALAWSSTDPTVVPVTQDGVVGGAAVGSATILCESAGVLGSLVVQVDREARRLVVEPAYVVFEETGTVQTVRAWDGAPVPGTPLLWSVTGAPEWLAAVPSSGGTPALVDLHLSRAGLPAGVHRAPVTFEAPGGTAVVTAEMTVSQVKAMIDPSTLPPGTRGVRVEVISGAATTATEADWAGGPLEVLVTVPSGLATVIVHALDALGGTIAQGQAQVHVMRGVVTDVLVGLG